MSDTILRAVAAALLVAVSAGLIRECGGRLAPLVSLGGGVVLLSLTLPRLASAVEGLSRIASLLDSTLLSSMLRILAVGYTVELGAELCRDLGEASCAAKLEACGRIEILCLSIPAILGVIELALSLLGAKGG